ncbi:type II CAAX endopeptidase family protein [Cellulomonas endophytica]|uniref:type II CAAX endopeptidase family protein n=1 Tax=Cellulomonas endophytica TaxID=2494735 RepID=UPI0010106C8B|nr:type II CAAX endopeptidase family protein [Cellulomonas endophytica]
MTTTPRTTAPAAGRAAPDGAPARRRDPLDVVRRHPLLSFVVLANVLSWLGWTPYVLSQHGLGLWDVRFPEALGSSQILGVLPGAYLGPIASALVVTAIADGRPGLRRWVGRMARWRVAGRWYALALLGVPAAMLLTGAVFSGGRVGTPPLEALLAYVPVLLLQVVTTGLAEEPGWRDFALPRLQDRFGPLAGSMVLGPLWALWHMPLFLSDWGGWPDAGWVRPVAFTVFCVAFNLVMTWVFNSTGQSLPLAVLAHVSVNTFASVIWGTTFPTIDADRAMVAMATGATVAAAVLVVRTRGRLGYPGPR